MTFEFQDIHHAFTDILIIGSGVAGLRAALAVDPLLHVTIVTKDQATVSNTQQAQGGIAFSLGEEGSVTSHIEDTLKVGCGLCDTKVVETVCRGGKSEFNQLIKWGARFDRHQGEYDFGLEGGHSQRRIIHSDGARTGKEIVRVLLSESLKRKNIKILENNFLVNFIQDEECVVGALVQESRGLVAIHASETLVASGGMGQVYRETSNPLVATGDGLAAASRINAQLKHMEFVQFHPTTLYIAGAARMLISEAVRGAGGRLVTREGDSFMDSIHPQGDLAPRDIVSREILNTIRKTGDTSVFLDVRHLKGFSREFPSLNQVCLEFGIEPSKELIPVYPSAHYHIGGIAVDLDGRTSVEGLFAAGEVACSGLHGANRLASNSLLEGLVLGKRTGDVMSACFNKMPRANLKTPPLGSKSFDLDFEDMRRSLRHLMWRHAGIVRDKKSLLQTQSQLKSYSDVLKDFEPQLPSQFELMNMVLVSQHIVEDALNRPKSCGVHFRSDSEAQTTSF